MIMWNDLAALGAGVSDAELARRLAARDHAVEYYIAVMNPILATLR